MPNFVEYFLVGSAKLAIRVLVESGVNPKNIMFLNLICAPEGLEALRKEYPEVIIFHILTLNVAVKFII